MKCATRWGKPVPCINLFHQADKHVASSIATCRQDRRENLQLRHQSSKATELVHMQDWGLLLGCEINHTEGLYLFVTHQLPPMLCFSPLRPKTTECSVTKSTNGARCVCGLCRAGTLTASCSAASRLGSRGSVCPVWWSSCARC